jgi:hypothetical protein
MKTLLGTGRLTWDGSERRTDRYGTVWLMEDFEDADSFARVALASVVNDTTAAHFCGLFGTLTAKVIATRKSTHIGDFFHGVAPRTPKVGKELVLGTGTFFVEPFRYGTGVQVGVVPDDGRSAQWLDMRALYDGHEQTVELYFKPEGVQ